MSKSIKFLACFGQLFEDLTCNHPYVHFCVTPNRIFGICERSPSWREVFLKVTLKGKTLIVKRKNDLIVDMSWRSAWFVYWVASINFGAINVHWIQLKIEILKARAFLLIVPATPRGFLPGEGIHQQSQMIPTCSERNNNFGMRIPLSQPLIKKTNYKNGLLSSLLQHQQSLDMPSWHLSNRKGSYCRLNQRPIFLFPVTQITADLITVSPALNEKKRKLPHTLIAIICNCPQLSEGSLLSSPCRLSLVSNGQPYSSTKRQNRTHSLYPGRSILRFPWQAREEVQQQKSECHTHRCKEPNHPFSRHMQLLLRTHNRLQRAANVINLTAPRHYIQRGAA